MASFLEPLVDPTDRLARRVWSVIVRHADGDATAARDLISSPPNYLNDCATLWAAFLGAKTFSADAGSTATPPQIVQFWDKAVPPEDVGDAISGWRALANGNHTLFDANSAVAFLRGTYGETEARLFASCPHPAMMADYFRLGYLAAEGGLYIDADMIARPEMQDVYARMGGKMVLWLRTHKPRMTVSNGVIAAPANSRLLTEAFNTASRRLADANQTRSFSGKAGPGLLRMVMADLVRRGEMDEFLAMPTRFVWTQVCTTLDADYKKDARNWTIWQKGQRP